MSKVSCNIIRDLFPSYIDKLTSDDSNSLIESHVSECTECAKILKDMQGDAEKAEAPSPKEKKEIDFLKKNKWRNRRIGLYCILGTILCVVLVLLVRAFGTGMQRLGSDNWYVEKIIVENGVIHLKATATDSVSVIKKYYVDETGAAIGGNGRVLISPMIVLSSPFLSSSKELTYELSDPSNIKEIWFGTQLIWANGQEISPRVATLYNEKHLYIGNMSSNARLAQALHANEMFGTYENKLETEKEPYGWILQLQTKMSESERDLREGYMQSFAYVSLGLIDNLDHVSFEYTVDGKATTKTFYAADATQFLGENIKNCYENPQVLSELMNKLGLLQ